jgi:hypothetical protein
VEHEVLAPLALQGVDDLESRSVPKVVMTRAWVSPRVKSAEPWVRGSTPVRMVMGRTVLVSRPSMRGRPSRMLPRTIRLSSRSMAPKTRCSVHLQPSSPQMPCTTPARMASRVA